MADLVGNYGSSYATGEATLAFGVSVNGIGELTAKWHTVDGEIPITDFAYEESKLTFDSKLGIHNVEA